jgi:hypothetical protein
MTAAACRRRRSRGGQVRYPAFAHWVQERRLGRRRSHRRLAGRDAAVCGVAFAAHAAGAHRSGVERDAAGWLGVAGLQRTCANNTTSSGRWPRSTLGSTRRAEPNKTRDRIKLLHWDGSGVRILAKRLERGRFSWPCGAGGDDRKLSLEPAGLTLLLDGVEPKDCAKKAWHERGKKLGESVSIPSIRVAMTPLADLPAAYLAIERDGLRDENGTPKDEVATLRRQLEKLRNALCAGQEREAGPRAAHPRA